MSSLISIGTNVYWEFRCQFCSLHKSFTLLPTSWISIHRTWFAKGLFFCNYTRDQNSCYLVSLLNHPEDDLKLSWSHSTLWTLFDHTPRTNSPLGNILPSTLRPKVDYLDVVSPKLIFPAMLYYGFYPHTLLNCHTFFRLCYRIPVYHIHPSVIVPSLNKTSYGPIYEMKNVLWLPTHLHTIRWQQS